MFEPTLVPANRRRRSGHCSVGAAACTSPPDERGQVEGVFHAVLDPGEMVVAIPGEVEVAIVPGSRGPGVGDEGTDLTERLRIGELAVVDEDGPMRVDAGAGGDQAVAAAGDQVRTRGFGALCRRGEVSALVVGDRIEAHIVPEAVTVDVVGSYERRRILRATCGFAGVRPLEEAVLDQHRLIEQPLGLAAAHGGFEQLVLDTPGRSVPEAEMAHEREGEDALRFLGNQVDPLKLPWSGTAATYVKGCQGTRWRACGSAGHRK